MSITGTAMWLLIGFCLIQVITRATFASAQGNNECRFESITLRIFFHLLLSIQQLVADTEHQLAHQEIPAALTLTPTLLQRFHAPDFLPRSLQCRIVNLFLICFTYSRSSVNLQAIRSRRCSHQSSHF